MEQWGQSHTVCGCLPIESHGVCAVPSGANSTGRGVWTSSVLANLPLYTEPHGWEGFGQTSFVFFHSPHHSYRICVILQRWLLIGARLKAKAGLDFLCRHTSDSAIGTSPLSKSQLLWVGSSLHPGTTGNYIKTKTASKCGGNLFQLPSLILFVKRELLNFATPRPSTLHIKACAMIHFLLGCY